MLAKKISMISPLIGRATSQSLESRHIRSVMISEDCYFDSIGKLIIIFLTLTSARPTPSSAIVEEDGDRPKGTEHPTTPRSAAAERRSTSYTSIRLWSAEGKRACLYFAGTDGRMGSASVQKQHLIQNVKRVVCETDGSSDRVLFTSLSRCIVHLNL